MSSEGCSFGPVRTMPGSVSETEAQDVCDCGAPATLKVQGETDSMGCEYLFMCKACAVKMREEAMQPQEFRCDFCKTERNERIIQYRDYEEGMCGRIYEICRPCKDKADAYDRAMADEMRDADEYY